MANAKRKGVMACRLASDPLLVDSERGYFCRSCGVEVQVTAMGQARIAAGEADPYCNSCGFRLAHFAHNIPQRTVYSSAALDQLGVKPVLPPNNETNLRRQERIAELGESGTVHVVEVYGRAGGARPLWAMCDCCGAKVDRLWIRAHYGFCIRADHVAYSGAWAWCVQCWALRDDFETLLARAATMHRLTDTEGLRTLWTVAFACMHGEVTEWQSGQLMPKFVDA